MSILASFFRRDRSRVEAAPQQVPGFVLPAITQQRGGRVICFYGGSEGNALREHSRWSLAPFQSLASQVVLIDWADPLRNEKLVEALSEPVWFVSSFFGLGQEIEINIGGKTANYWSAFGIPFVRHFGDLPAYFPDRHVSNYANTINVYCDASHSDFYGRWFTKRALVFTMPPLLLDVIPIDRVDVSKKLSGQIIFPKNGNSASKLRAYWRESLQGRVADMLDALAEECTAPARLNGRPRLDDLVLGFFEDIGIDISADRPSLCFFVAQLDDYMRRTKSQIVVEALLDLPVVIRGRFWEHIDFRGRRATYDPDSDITRTRALIDKAPAVIDMSPNTQDAPHDRVLRCIGRGTAFLTNRMSCFDVADLDPARYTFEFTPDAIRNLVERYVTNPRDAVELGLEQSRVFRGLYSDERYVNALMTAVDVCALRIGNRPAGMQEFLAFPPQQYD